MFSALLQEVVCYRYHISGVVAIACIMLCVAEKDEVSAEEGRKAFEKIQSNRWLPSGFPTLMVLGRGLSPALPPPPSPSPYVLQNQRASLPITKCRDELMQQV